MKPHCQIFLKALVPLSLVLSTQVFAAPLELTNSVQAGFEHDTNVFKTYNADRSDSLLRALLKTSLGVDWSKTALDISYRLGGKKYFSLTEQDTVINYFELGFKDQLTKRIRLSFTTEAKYQIENDSIDPDDYDINEDFFELKPYLSARFDLGRGYSLSSLAELELFDFNSNYTGLSYCKQRYGVSIYKSLGKPTEAGLSFSYDRYDFRDTARTDWTNEATAIFKYTGPVFLSAAYAFQKNHSTIESLSYINHKISMIASWPISVGGHQDGKSDDTDIALSLILILQFKNYPGVFGVDAEGRRYLLTESEEDNFNVIIFKLTKNFTKNFSGELKYTYHSNAFANTGQDYRRSTYYLGARFSF